MIAGPMSLVTEAPTLPAPNTPSAKPCCVRGNHALFQAMPELKNELPAKPMRNASTNSIVALCVPASRKVGTAASSSIAGHHHPAAPTVGQHAGPQPPDRAVEHRQRGQPVEGGVGEAELLLDRQAQDPELQPHREHQRERERRGRPGPGSDRRRRRAPSVPGERRPRWWWRSWHPPDVIYQSRAPYARTRGPLSRCAVVFY